MIDAAKTLERFGYLPSKWKSKSGKKVISICDECGAERVVRLAVAGKHCRTCAPKQPVTKAKVVAGLKRSWATARKNWKHSAATKEVLRGYQLGRPAWNKGLRGVFKPTAEHIAKLQAALKAKGRTPEHCQRISQALKGNTSSKGKHWVMSEQGKANLRASGAWKKGRPAWNKGKRLSPEHAAKAALANKGKIRSQDARDRASSSLKEYYRTNEHHQKGKPAWNKGKEGPWWQGDKNPNWSGGKSFEDYP
jgi:hypothetical protein